MTLMPLPALTFHDSIKIKNLNKILVLLVPTSWPQCYMKLWHSGRLIWMGGLQVNSVQQTLATCRMYTWDKKVTERTKRLCLHSRDSHSQTAKTMNSPLRTHYTHTPAFSAAMMSGKVGREFWHYMSDLMAPSGSIPGPCLLKNTLKRK